MFTAYDILKAADLISGQVLIAICMIFKEWMT